MSGHIASVESNDWNTPPYIIEHVKRAFDGVIDLDPAAGTNGVAATNYVYPQNDGLKDPWCPPHRRIFVNPPYNRIGRTTIRDWVRRCVDAYTQGASVIALLPVKTDTKFWQELIWPTFTTICFIRGRVRFINPKTGLEDDPAPMAVGCVYWGREPETFHKAFRTLGYLQKGQR